MVDKETKASQAGGESRDVQVQTENAQMTAQACQTETEIQDTQTDSPPPPKKETASQTEMTMEDFNDLNGEGNFINLERNL